MTTTTEFITALFCQVDDPLAVSPNTVWSKYSNLLSYWKLYLYHRPRFGLSSAPLLCILSVPTDGTG